MVVCVEMAPVCAEGASCVRLEVLCRGVLCCVVLCVAVGVVGVLEVPTGMSLATKLKIWMEGTQRQLLPSAPPTGPRQHTVKTVCHRGPQKFALKTPTRDASASLYQLRHTRIDESCALDASPNSAR